MTERVETGGRELALGKGKADGHLLCLAGNPNTGKSTIFNALTGMHQHTGNWPGKTVETAEGRYIYDGTGYTVVDLPGTYSLLSRSQEEDIAAQFISEGGAQCVAAVCDATNLERTLVLVLQVLELTDDVVVCVNLLDEAKKRGLTVDLDLLSELLGVPVVGAAAGRGKGLQEIRRAISQVAGGEICPRPVRVICEGMEEGPARLEALRGADSAASDAVAERLVHRAEKIAARTVQGSGDSAVARRQQKMDEIVLGRGGIPVMLVLLFGIFWLTIQGSNYPSAWLQQGFDALGTWLWSLADRAALPPFLSGALLDGIYAVTARVISVMLPPMAIFFPLFTLLEDFGYLPRVAFRLDRPFHCCGACGKQSLTMCMGFGCNAVGVTGCRIIDSPRERLLAILTNALVPCNGRFPTLILLIGVFFSGTGLFSGVVSALLLTVFVLLGVAATFGMSKLLSATVLRGQPSSFVMELPPYRRPQVLKVIVRSVIDRTVKVLGRAVCVAAPAGLLIWILANVDIQGASLLIWLSSFLDPVGAVMGLDGIILVAFLLGFPANEVVLPVAVMLLTSSGALGQAEDAAAVGQILIAAGWTWKTGLCAMIFCLFHWPCSTTCLTIHKETGSWKWTGLAILLPTALGFLSCVLVHFLLISF